MNGGTVTCDQCGQTVPESAACWYMATPVCGPCFTGYGGPVCGDCSDDMGDTFDTWADAVRDGLETIPCRVCGRTANAGV